MKTQWDVKYNVLYEMICFLNTLCVSKPYRDYYKNDYEYWVKRLDKKAVSEHIDLIKQKIYEQRNQIISSELCLYCSMMSDEEPTLEKVLNLTEQQLDTVRLKAEKTYWDNENWNAFVDVLPSIQSVLRALHENGFVDYWRDNYKNEIQLKCNEIKRDISHIDIISEIERICQKRILEHTVELYTAHYTIPHGIKLYGNRLIGMTVLAPTTMAWISLHEMIHTPYENGSDIQQIIDSLKNNPFISDAVENHEKWIGYNTYETYFDEQCTKALDHYIGERLHLIPNDAIPQSVDERRNQEDNGIHILFPVIYNLLKHEYDFSQSFEDFIISMFKKGKLLSAVNQTGIL